LELGSNDSSDFGTIAAGSGSEPWFYSSLNWWRQSNTRTTDSMQLQVDWESSDCEAWCSLYKNSMAWIPIKWCSSSRIIDIRFARVFAVEEFYILRSANSFNDVATSRIETDLWSSINFKLPNRPSTGFVTKYRDKYLTIDGDQCIVWSKRCWQKCCFFWENK
jgi:hypothetical protein